MANHNVANMLRAFLLFAGVAIAHALSTSFKGHEGVVAPPIVDPGAVASEVTSCVDHGGRPIPCTNVGEADRLRTLNLPALTRTETPWNDAEGNSAEDDRRAESRSWRFATLADYETQIQQVAEAVNAAIKADPHHKISVHDLALHNKQRVYEIALALEAQARHRLHETDTKAAHLESLREARADDEARYREKVELLEAYKEAREGVKANVEAWLEERRGVLDAAIAQAGTDAAAYEAHLLTKPSAPAAREPPAGKDAPPEDAHARRYRIMLNNRDFADYWSSERRFEMDKVRLLRAFEASDAAQIAEQNIVEAIEEDLALEELKIWLTETRIGKALAYEARARTKKEEKDAKLARVAETRAHLADVLVPDRAADTDAKEAAAAAHTWEPWPADGGVGLDAAAGDAAAGDDATTADGPPAGGDAGGAPDAGGFPGAP